MTYGIYMIRHVSSARVYIGSSIHIERRIKQHLYHLSKGTHSNQMLQRTCEKYGAGAFEFSVLEVLAEAINLFERETVLIAEFRSSERAFGFNLSPVGGSIAGMKLPNTKKRGPMAESTRRKLSEIARAQGRKPIGNSGRTFGPEARANMSAAHVGKLGRKWTEEERLQRAARGRKPWTEEARRNIMASRNVSTYRASAEHRQNLSNAATQAWAKKKADSVVG